MNMKMARRGDAIAGVETSSTNEGVGSYPTINVGDPPDGQQRLVEMRNRYAPKLATVVIFKTTGNPTQPLDFFLRRSFSTSLQGGESYKVGNAQYVVAKIPGTLTSIADRIRLGKVTGIDPKQRFITVDISNDARMAAAAKINPERFDRKKIAAGAMADRQTKFAERVGGPEKMATITFSNWEIERFKKFIQLLAKKRLTTAMQASGSGVLMGWSESMQNLADKIDIAEVLSVGNGKRTIKVKLPE